MVVVAIVVHSSGPELRGPKLGSFRGPSSRSSKIFALLAVGCCLSQVSLQTAAPTDMEMHPTLVTLAYDRTDCSHTMVILVVLDLAWVLRLCVVVVL